ncbi:MAG: hypothetical protein AAGN35_27995 [Bacteroidota bacterium]
MDTIHVPIKSYYALTEKVDFEKLTEAAYQDGTPTVVDGQLVNGDFTEVGHSRFLIFDNGKRMLETILQKDQHTFLLELTQIELSLRKLAHRARVRFSYSDLEGGSTIVHWTYAFEHKNFIARGMLRRFLKKKHQYWMRNFLSELKRQMESYHTSAHSSK